MSKQPDISVIMPVRNGERYIREALGSVLQQQAVDLEVVVVDDGSTDSTPQQIARIADRRVRIISGPERGVAEAMNAGLTEARGRYVARCDGDDRFLPGRLAQQLVFLESAPTFGAICGRFEVLDSAGRTIFLPSAAGEQPHELTQRLRNGRISVHLCTYLVRREPMLATGGFRSYFRTGSDIDFQLLLCEQTRVWYEPAARYGYRFHDESLTHRHAAELRHFYEATARLFQRQRAQRRVGDLPGRDDLQLGCPPPPPQPHDRPGGTELSSAREQVWQMRWGEAWRQHGNGQRARGVLLGLQATVQRPWRPQAWRGLAALCLKSVPLLHKGAASNAHGDKRDPEWSDGSLPGENAS